jgi:signal transduction histidine kinase
VGTATVSSVRALEPSRHSWGDAATAVVAFLVSLLVLYDGTVGVTRPLSRPVDATALVLVAVTALPLVAWRHRPVAVFVVAGLATAGSAAVGHPLGLPFGSAAALYAVAAHQSRAEPWVTRTTVFVMAVGLAYLVAAGFVERIFPWVELLHLALLWGTCWFAGERTRLRREQIAELHRESEHERTRARADERARIARDLHDSAGHAINVIAVRAGAARLRHHEDPARSLAALAAIEDLARQTVSDLDRLVGALRAPTDDEPRAVPIGLASLGALIAHHEATGLAVVSRTLGAPRPLPTGVDQAAYRILQEAMTNASRHGAGSVSVEVVYCDAALEVTVTNPVAGSTARAVPGGASGHGLVGARERVELLGGVLSAGRRGHRYVLHAALPCGTAAS